MARKEIGRPHAANSAWSRRRQEIKQSWGKKGSRASKSLFYYKPKARLRCVKTIYPILMGTPKHASGSRRKQKINIVEGGRSGRKGNRGVEYSIFLKAENGARVRKTGRPPV